MSSYIWEQWIEWLGAGSNLQVKAEYVKYNRLPLSGCLIGLYWIQDYFHNENCVSLSAVSELPFNLSYVPPALFQPQMWIYSHFSEISSNLWYLRSNSCLQWHLWELKHVETVVPKIKIKRKKRKQRYCTPALWKHQVKSKNRHTWLRQNRAGHGNSQCFLTTTAFLFLCNFTKPYLRCLLTQAGELTLPLSI